MTPSVQRTLDAVWRMDSARIIAYLARRLGDVGLAEDMAQESLMVALDKWSSDGLPDNPAAWLMTVAKHRAIDHWRKQKRQQVKWGELVQEHTFLNQTAQDSASLEDTVLDDDILSLIFTACHPVLSPEARGALTLKTVAGLLALMEIQASRLPARQNAQGEPILLMDQNRSQWDQLLLNHGFQALAKARNLSPAGPYTLQAEIAACHGRARRAEDTDWQAITQAYDKLYRRYPSPVIALNRAVAVSRAQGPQAGLVALEPLLTEESLQQYHLLPSVQGDFLFQLERWRDAAGAFEKAASLTHNRQEQALLRERARAAYAQEPVL